MKKRTIFWRMLKKEFKILKKNFNKEVDYFLSLSFKNYMWFLFFPKNKNFFFILIRLIILYPILRFIFDFILFIFTIIFNFYYIFFDFIFTIILKTNDIIFQNYEVICWLNLKIIRFFRYLILFIYFINKYAKFKKKNTTLWLYIFESLADFFIRVLRRRLKIRYLLYPFIRLLELLVVLIFFLIYAFLGLFYMICFPIVFIISINLYKRFIFYFGYYRAIYRLWRLGPYYFSDVALLQISTMLQQNGFVAPKCDDVIQWTQAKIAYKRYRRKYKKAELTPDVLDNDALNIFIYLKYTLLADTRYRRKVFGFWDWVIVVFPYGYVMEFYALITSFVIGLFYSLYLICFPILVLYVIYFFLSVLWEIYFYIFSFSFKKIDYLLYLKRKEIRVAKRKKRMEHRIFIIESKVNKIKKFFKDKINIMKDYYIELKNKINKNIIDKIKKFLIKYRDKIKVFLKKVYRIINDILMRW